MKFVVFDKDNKILRGGHCQDRAFHRQTEVGEFIMEGRANDVTQKVEFDGLDDKGQPINPRVVNKPQAEIERDNPKTKPVSPGKRRAFITNEQLDSILQRLDALEGAPE